MAHNENPGTLAVEYADKHPKEILARAFELEPNIAISFSGAEDVVLIDLARKVSKDLQVFTLDTGRLHPETYRFIDQVREHYDLAIDVLSPDAEKLEAYVKLPVSAKTRAPAHEMMLPYLSRIAASQELIMPCSR